MSTTEDAARKAMEAGAQWEPCGTPDRLVAKPEMLGRSISRIDGPLKVAGRARFAAEVQLDGMLYAALVYSTIARGRIGSLNVEAAETAPGVVLVMTHRNAPSMKVPMMFGAAPDGAGPSRLPVMQDDAVRWNGHPVAVVLADSQEQADHAATLVKVAYEPEGAVTDFEAAKTNAYPPQNVLGEPSDVEIGDAEAAWAEAPVRLDETFSTPRHNHNAIEPHAVTCLWDGGTLVVHDANQLITASQRTLAGVFDLPPDKVRIFSPYVGGAFGGKCMWWHQILAAAAAKIAGRPVRMALSREGVYRLIGGRTTTEQRVKLGARPDGTLLSLMHSGVAAMTSHNDCPEQFTFPARHMYATGALKVEQRVADMDMLANTFMRAPGESVGTFALECAMDELAERLSLDPVELRRRNDPRKDPASGRDFSSRNLVEAYRLGAKRFGWSRRPQSPRTLRQGEWLIGMGCASGTYPYYRMPGGAARITLAADGTAVVSTAAHEMGMGTATVQRQICADRLGLPLEAVTFQYGDSHLPPGTVAGGSSQTASIGAAVVAAQAKMVAELLKLATNDSPLAGLSAEEVEPIRSGLAKRDDPRRHESYAAILRGAGRQELTADADAPPPLEMMRWSMHSTSAIFCEMHVNAVSGETRVARLLGVFDCGRILNPKTAASQFRGGMIMGIGLALSEETLFDPRNGRIMNPSLAEYHVPVHMDVPEIEVLWTDIPDPQAPMGARGIGEIGITGTAAAIANALYNATGQRVRGLPITLDKLLV